MVCKRKSSVARKTFDRVLDEFTGKILFINLRIAFFHQVSSRIWKTLLMPLFLAHATAFFQIINFFPLRIENLCENKNCRAFSEIFCRRRSRLSSRQILCQGAEWAGLAAPRLLQIAGQKIGQKRIT